MIVLDGSPVNNSDSELGDLKRGFKCFVVPDIMSFVSDKMCHI